MPIQKLGLLVGSIVDIQMLSLPQQWMTLSVKFHCSRRLVTKALLRWRWKRAESNPEWPNNPPQTSTYAKVSISDAGKPFYKPDISSPITPGAGFCYVKMALVEIGQFTEPSEMHGVQVSRVSKLIQNHCGKSHPLTHPHPNPVYPHAVAGRYRRLLRPRPCPH